MKISLLLTNTDVFITGENELEAQRHEQIHAETDTIWKVQPGGM